MTRAYLFLETGEVRAAKDGEYYQAWANIGYCKKGPTYSDDYPILTRHEIEIPDGTDEVRILSGNERGLHEIECIPIPRPKKVKKWQWLYVHERDGLIKITEGHYTTEEDVKKNFFGNRNRVIRPIEETCIEVEE